MHYLEAKILNLILQVDIDRLTNIRTTSLLPRRYRGRDFFFSPCLCDSVASFIFLKNIETRKLFREVGGDEKQEEIWQKITGTTVH